MKSKTKKYLLLGGAVAFIFLLYKKYGSSRNEPSEIKQKDLQQLKPLSVKPPKKVLPSKPTPTPPYKPPTSSSGGTGGMVTNNQTVPQNYNPRDYGDIVLGSVDRGRNRRR